MICDDAGGGVLSQVITQLAQKGREFRRSMSDLKPGETNPRKHYGSDLRTLTYMQLPSE